MNPSLDLVTDAFARLHAGTIDLEPARGTGMGLTGPEAAALYMGVVKAVERLPAQPKAWAYYTRVDGKRPGDAEWEARTIILNTRESLQWIDPKSWLEDPAKPEQKRKIVQHIVRAVPRREAIVDQDLAAVAGLEHRNYLQPSRLWGKYREAINRVFDAWDSEILDAVSYALERSRAA